MPIIKTEILGSKFEINYQEEEYEKLLNLIDNFKKRLNEFPNDGRTNNNSIIFLTALKIEDELDEIKRLYEKNKNQNKKLDDQKVIIENLKKEIILLNDSIQNINSKKLSEDNDYSKSLNDILKLENEIELIKKKIKEAINE